MLFCYTQITNSNQLKIILPFVICAGSGEGHCRGVCTFVFLAPVDDKGRSKDEHLCYSVRKFHEKLFELKTGVTLTYNWQRRST